MSNLDRIFFFTACFFSLIYVFLVPPFQAPDEAHHLYRVAHIQSGHLMGIKTVDQRLGGELSLSYPSYAKQFDSIRYNYDVQISPQAISPSEAYQDSATAFVDFPNVGYYAPTSYLVHSLATAIAHHMSMPWQLYANRIISVLIWFVCLWLCVRLNPALAPFWLLLGTLPATLFLHGSVTADVINNGIGFISIALILRMLIQPDTVRKIWPWFLAIMMMLTFNKVVYAPIWFGLLLVKNPYKKRSQWLSLLAGQALILILIIYFVYIYLGDLFIPYEEYNPDYREGKQINPGVDPESQLKWIFGHPWAYLKVATHSWSNSLVATTAHYFAKFGWEANYYPIWTYPLLMIGVALSAISSRITLSKNTRLTFLTMAFTMIVGMTTLIYLQWNAVGDPLILALSGRYFILIFPFIWLAVAGLKFRKNSPKWSYAIWAICWLIGVWEVVDRYWTLT